MVIMMVIMKEYDNEYSLCTESSFRFAQEQALARLALISMGVNDIFSRASDSNLHSIKLRAKASHTTGAALPSPPLPFPRPPSRRR